MRAGPEPRRPEPPDQEDDVGGAEPEPEPEHHASLVLAGIPLILRRFDLSDSIYRPFQSRIYL